MAEARLPVLLFVAILAKALLALVRGDFVTLTLTAAGHGLPPTLRQNCENAVCQDKDAPLEKQAAHSHHAPPGPASVLRHGSFRCNETSSPSKGGGRFCFAA